jgi:hypothetical protein
VAVDLVEEIDIDVQFVTLKFGVSLQTASIHNDCFTVATDAATPVAITDPFLEIAVAEDYNPISRILSLSWSEDALEPNTDYTLTIAGLKNVIGQELSELVLQFTTGDSVNTSTDGIPVAPPTTSVIDYSIVSGAFDDIVVNPANQLFGVDTADPINGDYYLPADYNNGRVTVTFTEQPDIGTLNSNTVKVQKRPIQRGPSRWETIDVRILSSATLLYIDFPAIDHYPETATPYEGSPIFYTSGYSYFEENMKYRIILSKNISS